MVITLGLRQEVKAFRLVCEGEIGPEQIYCSSDNQEAMRNLFGCDGFRCPVISPKKDDVYSQILQAVRHPDVVIEVGRNGKREAKNNADKQKLMKDCYEQES